MTTDLVNHETGEIVETIGADEARRLTTEAQNEFRSSAEHFNRGWSLIEQAVEGGGHVDLGYRSPGDYLHSEFDGVLSGLDVAARRVAVKAMSGWGLSTRAIAKPLGISQKTADRDVRAAGESHDSPELPPFAEYVEQFVSATDALAEMDQAPAPYPLGEVGGDAGQQSSVRATGLSAGEAEPTSSAPMSDTADTTTPERGADPTPPPAPSNVVGLDGKTYKRPTPSKPRRKPLPDAARDAGWDLRKSVERLERIASDDRFDTNKQQVAPQLRGHLENAIEVLTDLLDRINN